MVRLRERCVYEHVVGDNQTRYIPLLFIILLFE
jgi:hypothetical protein